jgi:hypothetical protein
MRNQWWKRLAEGEVPGVVAMFEMKILLRVSKPDRKTGHSPPSIDSGQTDGKY